MEEKNKCVMCKPGTVEWNYRTSSYVCTNCDFEISFNAKLPKYHLHRKMSLGSFIDAHKNESDLERRLRTLHKKISISEDWEMRKQHFEAQVRRAKKDVLAEWAVRVKGNLSELEKGRIIIEIANDFGLPITAASEILYRSGKCKQAPFHVWDYQINKKYGRQVDLLWRTFNGQRAVKSGNFVRLATQITKISERIGLNVYSTSQVLKRKGLCLGGHWALWSFEKLQEYGLMLGRLWENRECRVKNDWTLCEVVDSISRDLKLDDPYFVINALASTKRVNLESGSAFTTYSKYKYAKLALEFIEKSGPKKIHEVGKKFGIVHRVAACALELLANTNLVNVYGGKNKIFYCAGQEKQLRKIAPFLRLEDEIIASDYKYLTSHKIMELAGISESKAEVLLNSWAREGKIKKISRVRDGKEIVYIISKHGQDNKVVAAALRIIYKNILDCLKPDGVSTYRIQKESGLTCWTHLKNKLNVMEKYGLICEKGGLYYLVGG
ncbi:MAG: hypothetical protein HY438_00790 [DPANN group archaeon]|nr:hypothetical protein [DPANN group archaeon]